MNHLKNYVLLYDVQLLRYILYILYTVLLFTLHKQYSKNAIIFLNVGRPRYDRGPQVFQTCAMTTSANGPCTGLSPSVTTTL